jgi:hypothetical protein
MQELYLITWIFKPLKLHFTTLNEVNSIQLILNAYLQINNTCVTRLYILLLRAFALPILYVARTLKLVHVKDVIDKRFIIPLFAVITKLRTCILIEMKASTSVLPSDIMVALRNDGCNYMPKHVVVNVMTKLIYKLL